MPRYLALLQLSAEGMKGLLKEKAAAREAAVRQMIESGGGKLEAWYWAASGEYNVAAIAESPDAATASAHCALLMSTGVASKVNIIELLTASEIDRALGKSMTYRPPGG